MDPTIHLLIDDTISAILFGGPDYRLERLQYRQPCSARIFPDDDIIEGCSTSVPPCNLRPTEDINHIYDQVLAICRAQSGRRGVSRQSNGRPRVTSSCTTQSRADHVCRNSSPLISRIWVPLIFGGQRSKWLTTLGHLAHNICVYMA